MCDHTWQVTLYSPEIGFPLTFNYTESQQMCNLSLSKLWHMQTKFQNSTFEQKNEWMDIVTDRNQYIL